MAIETEIKVIVPQTVIVATCAQHGWALRTPRTFEDNWLWDTPDGRLQQRHELLRLRRFGPRVTLTWKGPTTGTSQYKVREEWEVMVGDFTVMQRILERLGYRVWFRYQKYRTEYTMGDDLHITVDETPIGTFVELEGPPDAIERAIDRFGWREYPRTTANYYRLFLEAVAAGRYTGSHMLFPEHPEGESGGK